MRNKHHEEPEFVTLPVAARKLGIGVRQIRRALDEGCFDVFDIGGWPRVRWHEVRSWVETTRRTARDSASEVSTPEKAR